jgi:hypothetical protein
VRSLGVRRLVLQHRRLPQDRVKLPHTHVSRSK